MICIKTAAEESNVLTVCVNSLILLLFKKNIFKHFKKHYWIAFKQQYSG